MHTKIIEVTNGPHNHGKVLVGRFTEEWDRPCLVDEEVGETRRGLLQRCGWSSAHALVVDLQTGEGALFRLGGLASADLRKTRIWVCPLFEPCLEWLYVFSRGRADWFADLPARLDLPDAPFAMSGYRRPGREGEPSAED